MCRRVMTQRIFASSLEAVNRAAPEKISQEIFALGNSHVAWCRLVPENPPFEWPVSSK